MNIRNTCECLLTAQDFFRYQALHDSSDDENRQSEWSEFLQRFDPGDEEIGSSDNEGQANFRDDIETNSKVMRERFIAYHQLKAFSSFFRDQPAQVKEAFHQFLVSIFSFLHVFYCNDKVSHHHCSVGALQS